jgi:hypothetical protein
VLGGGLDVRPAAAAELYKLGKASRVAIGFSEYDQGRDARLTRTKLLQHGVPATAINEFRFAAAIARCRGKAEESGRKRKWTPWSRASRFAAPGQFCDSQRWSWQSVPPGTSYTRSITRQRPLIFDEIAQRIKDSVHDSAPLAGVGLPEAGALSDTKGCRRDQAASANRERKATV